MVPSVRVGAESWVDAVLAAILPSHDPACTGPGAVEPADCAEPADSAEPTNSPEPTSSAMLVDGAEPIDSAEPATAEPVEGADPADRAEPANVAVPTGRSELANSAESADRMEPVEGAELADSVEPANSAEPANSVEPANSAESADSAGPTEHPASIFAAATGLAAADLLVELVPADLDDFTLGEALRATERVASWAASVQARIIQEMTARAGSHAEWVRDDVAALLRMTGQAAQILTNRSETLELVPELHSALATGRVDTRRVDTVVRTATPMGVAAMRDVVTELLPRAGEMTAPQLRDAIRDAEAVRDAAALEVRAEAAQADRCVVMETAPDAMAWITAYLPAADAMTVWSAIDALARRPDSLDGRKLDQRRADALTETMRAVLDRGTGADGTPLPRAHGRHPHLSVIASPEVLVPGAVGVATLEGYGPVPASVARRVAADADWRAVGIDPLTGEAAGISSGCYRPSEKLAAALVARDVTCTFPGCRQPAVRCDLDHIVPFDPDRPAAEQTCYVNLHALCRRHHRLKTSRRWSVERDADTGRTTWTDHTGREHTRDPVPLDRFSSSPAPRPADDGVPDGVPHGGPSGGGPSGGGPFDDRPPESRPPASRSSEGPPPESPPPDGSSSDDHPPGDPPPF